MRSQAFVKNEVTYLGKIINEDGIKPDVSTLVKLDNFFIPRTRKGLMQLLGFINWFRDHVPNLSQRLAHITNKLSYKDKFTWSEEDSQVISSITDIIRNQILLHHPDTSKPFVLTTDASDIGTGGILTQEDNIVGIFR